MKQKKIDRVSVITTFYNAEKYVLQAIGSVSQQMVKGFELEYIIVDDKSTDSSRQLISDFLKEQANPYITYKLVEPEVNLGCGGARKFGIDNATGDYFMFLDADDYYLNVDFVYRAYNELKRSHADIVEYGVLFNQPDGTQHNHSINQRVEITDPKIMQLALFKDNAIKFNVWTKIYTKDIVKSYPYSTTRTYEDVRTIPIWISNAKKIVIMPTPEVNYRAATNSIIREDQIKTRLGTITAIAELFDNELFNSDIRILRAMYGRAMVDLEALLHNHSCKDPGFNEMSALNTKMLKYIYPNDWKNLTYEVTNVENTQTSNSANLIQKPINEEGKIDLSKITGWDEDL